MPQDSVRQLLDFVAVHGFYLSTLEIVTGEPVPVPVGVGKEETTGNPVEQSLSILRRWLKILDMAITAPMLRDGLTESTSASTAEALLRYYTLKTSHTDVDRDKCDFVVTFLYRNWRRERGLPPGPSDVVQITIDESLSYEGEIYTILGDVEPPELPQEHLQLAREFEPLLLEVDDFTHFDKLIDSGVMQRVRELKQRFGKSFYHPHVLARVAIHNSFFGHRFDELFRKAADEIKNFAESVQQGGGSVMTRVDGEVTVQQLANVGDEEDEMLHEEYGKARERFRKVAQFRKAVDGRRRRREAGPVLPPPPVAAEPAQVAIPVAPPPVVAPLPPVFNDAATVQHIAATQGPAAAAQRAAFAGTDSFSFNKGEEHKVDNMCEVIRSFVTTAEAAFANVVPLRSGANMLLTPAEVDAFRNPYLNEESYRAQLAAVLRRMAGMIAAMMVETEDFKRKRNSAYLWKQHADSLQYFVRSSTRLMERARQVRELSERRGLVEKVKALDASIERLTKQAQEVAKTLQA